MSIVFPTNLDSLTNPVASDQVTVVHHAVQHSDVNDAIEAIEAKLGIDSSAVNTSIDYLLKNANSLNPGHKHNASNILMTTVVGTPTYTTQNDFNNSFGSTGRKTGGVGSDAGSSKVAVTGGTGFIKATDDDNAQLMPFNWTAPSDITIPANSSRYIGVEYNAGSPQVVARTTANWDYDTDFPLLRVVNDTINGAEEIYIANTPWWVTDGMTNVIQAIRSFGLIRRDEYIGGLILSNTGTRNIAVSAGTVWAALNDTSFAGLDTASSGSVEGYWYKAGSGWQKSDLTQWSKTQWNDITQTTLQTISANKYCNVWIYGEMNATGITIALVYPQAQYNTAAEAEAKAAPDNLPAHISQLGMLLGRFIIKQNVDTPVSTQSVFTTKFSTSVVTSHPNLGTLGWTSAGHTGTASTIAGFAAGTGVAAEYTLSGTGTVLATNTSPSFTTPTLGVAIGTSLALGGATIGTNALAITGTSTHSALVEINLNTVAGPASLTGTALRIVGTDNTAVRVGISSFGTAGLNAFACRHARNTAASPQAVQSGDQLFSLEGWGYGTTGYSSTPKVMVRGYAGQTWEDAKQSTYFSIWTTPTDSVTPAERLRISQDGTVAIGTTDLDGTPAIGKLTIKGTTNDGSTNIIVGRDSDETNVFSIDTNGKATFDSIELGHASDTTITRISAGVVAIEGVNILTVAGGTLTGNIILGENTSVQHDPSLSADGKYTGLTITGTAGATIAFGDLITLDKDDSRWELVDISVGAAATGDGRGILGMAVSAGNDGDTITILLNGVIRADANFPTLTIGAAVYASTTGDVVVAQPSTADYVIRIVGYGLTADSIYFNPENDFITHI